VTVLDQAQAAYGTSVRVTRTPRDSEFEVLARITRRLRSAAEPDAAYSELASAIHDNRSLWSIFANDLLMPGNALPRELRERLLYLARFVDDHSSKVLRNSATVDALVEINTAVMRGLRPSETRE
jgi:flagellar protein FlaF